MNLKKAPWLLISLLVIIIDQITKHAMVTHFAVGQPYVVCSFFNLLLTYNPGASFGFLAGMGGAQVYLFAGIALIVSIAFIGWLLRTPQGHACHCLGLSLIIGGAVGNLMDRLRIGHVIDFFQFHVHGWSFAIFNVADSAVTVGAICLIASVLLSKKPIP